MYTQHCRSLRTETSQDYSHRMLEYQGMADIQGSRRQGVYILKPRRTTLPWHLLRGCGGCSSSKHVALLMCNMWILYMETAFSCFDARALGHVVPVNKGLELVR